MAAAHARRRDHSGHESGPFPRGEEVDMLTSLPLLVIGLVIYNLVTLTVGATAFDQHMMTIAMRSGDAWKISYGDLFEICSLGLLFVEIVRATATGTSSVINHVLSMVVFVLGLVEFLLLPGFGNSTFFIFLVMTLLDVVAGFIVTIAASRRDLAIGER